MTALMMKEKTPAVIPGDHGRLASSPLLLACALSALCVAVGVIVRPRIIGGFGGFGNDAQTIQTIMSSPFDAAELGLGSYAVIAQFYTAIGLADSPGAAGILGALVGALLLSIVIIRVEVTHASRLALVLALITPLLIGVYMADYSKEVLIAAGLLVIALLPANRTGEVLLVGVLVLLGAEFRTYWFIVAALYVIIRLLLSRRCSGTVARVMWMLIILSLLTGLAVWIGAGVPADSFRTDANDTVSRQSNTGSLITRFIDAPEPVGGMVNATLTSLFFIVPVPMLLKLSPYYLVIGILFALFWVSAVRAAAVAGKNNPLLMRFAALPLAFLIVQGLFEPDWGSALRHATPLIPLIIGAVALSEQERTQYPDSPPPQHSTPTARPSHRRTIMTSQTTAQPGGNRTTNVLADYLGHLRRYWWMLVVGCLIGGLGGWGVSALMTDQYTATAQVYVGTASTGSSGDAYQGALLSQKQVGSYAEIANGRALGQLVVDDLDLDKSADEVSGMITASAYKDTVILNLRAVSDDADLARDVANSAAEQLQTMVKDLNEQTSPTGRTSSAPQLALLTEAETPSSPSSPNTSVNILVGAVLGLAVGALAAIIRGLTDRRITDSDSIRGIVEAPLVGTVGYTDVLSETRHMLNFSAAPVVAAEQFRELRTNLRFLDVDNAPSVIAVTSGMSGEGKSTVALNLALALADDGESVCLVDADLRNPSLVSYVGGDLQSAVGLSTALAGDTAVADVIQLTQVDGLSVIASGPIPPNPAELLGSRRFKEALAYLAEHFDHVILDASPVLPVTDGALVASSADGVLLAVRHNSSTTDQLAATGNSLAAVNSRVLGTVFTMTPEGKGKSSYSYSYGYGTASATGSSSGGPVSESVETPHQEPHDIDAEN